MGELGQVVIPQEFRKHMSLRSGDKFMVMGQGDMLMLKRLKAPSAEEFEIMVAEGHSRAKRLKLSEKDLEEARKRSRK
jgi:bifunctional DNA-binding transcriptional regulator/antitoxin component of YhaV-PrlF toxin-antitoxin module